MSNKTTKINTVEENEENSSSRQVVYLEDVDEAIMHVACVAIGILHEDAFPVPIVDRRE